jgi:hypothetical protein
VNTVQSEGKGFAGLSSLVSDIKLTYEANVGEHANISLPIFETANDPVVTPPSSLFSSLFSYKIIGSILTIIFIVYLINSSTQTLNPPSRARKSDVASITPQNVDKNSELQYERPPVGEARRLTVSQIRWVLREDIRIDAMRDVISTNKAIREFNRIVDDYNRRGANFRYYESDMRNARRDVDAARKQIVSEAIKEALRWEQDGKFTGKSTSPASASGKNTSTASREAAMQETEETNNDRKRGLTATDIKEAQQLLKNLGYNPGPIDGKAGRLTILAVKMFQKT